MYFQTKQKKNSFFENSWNHKTMLLNDGQENKVHNYVEIFQ